MSKMRKFVAVLKKDSLSEALYLDGRLILSADKVRLADLVAEARNEPLLISYLCVKLPEKADWPETLDELLQKYRNVAGNHVNLVSTEFIDSFGRQMYGFRIYDDYTSVCHDLLYAMIEDDLQILEKAIEADVDAVSDMLAFAAVNGMFINEAWYAADRIAHLFAKHDKAHETPASPTDTAAEPLKRSCKKQAFDVDCEDLRCDTDQ